MASKRKKDLGPIHVAKIRCVAAHSRFVPPVTLVFSSASGTEERHYPSECGYEFPEGFLHLHTYRDGDPSHRSLLEKLDSGAWELVEVDGMRREPDALPK